MTNIYAMPQNDENRNIFSGGRGGEEKAGLGKRAGPSGADENFCEGNQGKDLVGYGTGVKGVEGAGLGLGQGRGGVLQNRTGDNLRSGPGGTRIRGNSNAAVLSNKRKFLKRI